MNRNFNLPYSLSFFLSQIRPTSGVPFSSSSTPSGCLWFFQDWNASLRREKGQEKSPFIHADIIWHWFPLGIMGDENWDEVQRIFKTNAFLWCICAFFTDCPYCLWLSYLLWPTCGPSTTSPWPLVVSSRLSLWGPNTHSEVTFGKNLFRMTHSLLFAGDHRRVH